MAAKDSNGFSDPYVRVTLLPDKKHRLETKIKRRTLNPRWNETFYFEGFPINKLQSRVLHLHCFDYDRFSKDDSIGEIHLPLCQVSFSRDKGGFFFKKDIFFGQISSLFEFSRQNYVQFSLKSTLSLICQFDIVANPSF